MENLKPNWFNTVLLPSVKKCSYAFIPENKKRILKWAKRIDANIYHFLKYNYDREHAILANWIRKVKEPCNDIQADLDRVNNRKDIVDYPFIDKTQDEILDKVILSENSSFYYLCPNCNQRTFKSCSSCLFCNKDFNTIAEPDHLNSMYDFFDYTASRRITAKLNINDVEKTFIPEFITEEFDKYIPLS